MAEQRAILSIYWSLETSELKERTTSLLRRRRTAITTVLLIAALAFCTICAKERAVVLFLAKSL